MAQNRRKLTPRPEETTSVDLDGGVYDLEANYHWVTRPLDPGCRERAPPDVDTFRAIHRVFPGFSPGYDDDAWGKVADVVKATGVSRTVYSKWPTRLLTAFFLHRGIELREHGDISKPLTPRYWNRNGDDGEWPPIPSQSALDRVGTPLEAIRLSPTLLDELRRSLADATLPAACDYPETLAPVSIANAALLGRGAAMDARGEENIVSADDPKPVAAAPSDETGSAHAQTPPKTETAPSPASLIPSLSQTKEKRGRKPKLNHQGLTCNDWLLTQVHHDKSIAYLSNAELSKLSGKAWSESSFRTCSARETIKQMHLQDLINERERLGISVFELRTLLRNKDDSVRRLSDHYGLTGDDKTSRRKHKYFIRLANELLKQTHDHGQERLPNSGDDDVLKERYLLVDDEQESEIGDMETE
jgi:hypothetical protein